MFSSSGVTIFGENIAADTSPLTSLAKLAAGIWVGVGEEKGEEHLSSFVPLGCTLSTNFTGDSGSLRIRCHSEFLVP